MMKKRKLTATLLAFLLAIPMFTGVMPVSAAVNGVPYVGSVYIPSCTVNRGGSTYVEAPIFDGLDLATQYRLEGAPAGVDVFVGGGSEGRWGITFSASEYAETGVYDVRLVFVYRGGDESGGEGNMQIWDEPVSNVFKLRVGPITIDRFIEVVPAWDTGGDPAFWRYDMQTGGIPEFRDIMVPEGVPHPALELLTLDGVPDGISISSLMMNDGRGTVEFTADGGVSAGTYLATISYQNGEPATSLTSNKFLLVVPRTLPYVSTPINPDPPLTEVGSRFISNLIEYEVTDVTKREVQAIGFIPDIPLPEHHDLVIPSAVNYGLVSYSVVAVAQGAFMYHGSETVTIGEGVKSIGTTAFFNALQCTSVSIPSTVSEIGQGAFGSCWELADITVDSGNNYYKSADDVLYSKDGRYLLCYPPAKTEANYTVPDGVTEIWAYAFSSADISGDLKTILLPDSLTRVWEQGLGCASLESLRIPAGLNQLQFGLYGVFFGAKSLKTLTVDEGNTMYKAVDNVLFSKDGETLVYYPEGSPNAHYNVPEGTKTLGMGSFIRTATVTGALESVTLPDTLVSVASQVFRFQTKLASVNIPESLTEIGAQMFLVCESLTSITLHSGITKIGNNAFMGCKSLQRVTCEAAVAPQLGTDSFGIYYSPGTFEKFVLRIPDEDSLDSYTQAGWLEYASQVQYLQGGELPSDDATLSALTVSTGTLTPAFSANIASYTVTVPNTVTSIDIAAAATHAEATVAGTGTKNLSVGDNAFTITVTAEDEATTKDYTITVTREAVAPGISGPLSLTLREGYAADSTDAFRISGTAPVTVSKMSGDSKITWNSATNRLDIAAGLTAGTYIVTLKAANGTAPDATITFTLTVNEAEKPLKAVVEKMDAWTGSGPAVMRIDAPFRDFLRLLLNGSPVDRIHYDVAEGSTIITLKEAFIKQLGNGTYELVAEFRDGVTGTAQFVVNADTTKAEIPTAQKPPVTGDTGNMFMWILLAGTSLIVLCGVLALYRRNTKRGETH